MTKIQCTQPQPHSTTGNGTSPRRASLSSARRRSLRLSYEGVTAAYIHDISRRHRRSAPYQVTGVRRPAVSPTTR